MTSPILPGVREVMGVIPVWDSDVFLAHTCVVLISSFFRKFQVDRK